MAPCTWSARPRARCCKGEIPVQFHLPELNSPMRTEEKVGFVPPFVPPLGPGYPPFCPMLEVSRKFFRHIPSAPRAAAQQHLSRCTSTTAAPGRQCLSRCTCTARPAPAPCTWSAPWQASASAPAPGRHQALTQQQAQQHALELREQMPSVLRPSKRLHPGPRTLVCEPDKGVTFTFVGSFVGTFWIFRASS